MKLLSNKSALLKSGVAIAVAAVAVLNFSLTNAKSIQSVTTVSAAQATTCIDAAGGQCYVGQGPSGNYFISNMENI